MSIVVPKPGEPLVEEDRLPTKPWYNYLTQNANELANVTTVTTADIEAAIDAASTEFKINSGISSTSTGGTEHSFTSLPSSIKRLTVTWDSISLSSVANYVVQLGTSLGTASSGYFSMASFISSSAESIAFASTSGFLTLASGTSGSGVLGNMEIMRLTSDTWIATHSGASTSRALNGAGRVTLGSELTQVRLASTSTANNVFRTGQVNIHWEF